MAVCKETSVDAPIITVLQELDGIFTLKELRKGCWRIFFGGQLVFTVFLTYFGKSLVEH